MHLYLRDDLLSKAVEPPAPPGGGPKTTPMAAVSGGADAAPSSAPAASSGPKTVPMPERQAAGIGSAAAKPSKGPGELPAGMQVCSVGGIGGRCEELGGPPGGADTHKIGGAAEIEHSRQMAAKGAGAPQEETATEEKPDSPEEAKKKNDDASTSFNSLRNETQGVSSVKPEDYPEDSQPMDHYKVAAALEAQGGGNDSSKELAEGHRNIARQRAEAMTPQDHTDLAQQLNAEGMSKEAQYHEQTAKEGTAKEEEARDAGIGSEFDKLIEQFDDKQAAGKIAKDALAEHKKMLASRAEGDEADKQAAGKIAKDSLGDYKNKWSEEKYNDHKEKKSAHEQAMLDHTTKKPRQPPPFTDKPPDPDSFPEDGSAYKTAQKEHGKKKTASQKEHATHKKDMYDWQQKDRDLKDAHQEYKAQDKDFKEAEGERKTQAKADEATKKASEKKAKDEESAASKESAAKAKEEADKPRAPASTMEHAQVAGHKESASKASANMDAWLEHLDTDMEHTEEEKDQIRAKIQMVQNGLQTHMNLQHVPTNDHKAELKELIGLAGEHGKAPPEHQLAEGADPEAPKAPKKRSVNLVSAFESGRQFGTRLGRAAATGEMAGSIGSDILNYGGRGVVSAGQHLLNKPRQADTKDPGDPQREAVDKMMAKDPSNQPQNLGQQAASARQEDEGTHKSLFLDLNASLDLLKAVQTPNTAVSSPSDKTAQRQLKTSYAQQPTGVLGGAGLAMYDDPKVGAKWKHDPEDSIEEELDEDSKAKDEDGTVKKSMLTTDLPETGISMIRGLNKSLSAALEPARYNPREVEFMSEVMGESDANIRKGLVCITGRNRHRFHEWLIDRMNKSMVSMGDYHV